MYQNPYKGKFRISCPFKKKGGWSAGYHIGIDLVGDSKTLYPIHEGTVQSINSKGSAYGNHVLIAQSDGKVALYAHLKEICVAKHQKVTLTTIIGIEGSTGNSSGSHLHLELHNGYYKYPNKNQNAPWLNDPIEIINKSLEEQMELLKKIESVERRVKKLETVEELPQVVSDWAKSGQEFVTSTGISDGNRPLENVTRQELWVMLERFSKLR